MNIKQTLNNRVEKKTAFAIIAIAVVIALIWGISCIRKNKSAEPVLEDVVASQEEVTESTPVATKKPTNSGNTAAAPSMSYEEALRVYEGRRIQFDESCIATPFQHTYKNGTSIMLDNRSNQMRSIYDLGQTVNIPAYGFKVITLSATTFPKTLLVDCDSRQNVATIIIQK